MGASVAARYSRPASRRNLGGESGSTVTVTVVVLRPSVSQSVNGRHARGGTGGRDSRGVGDDGRLLEAGAVGLAGLDGLEAVTGAGDLAGAVVAAAVAVAGLEEAGGGGGNKGQDNGGLHLDGVAWGNMERGIVDSGTGNWLGESVTGEQEERDGGRRARGQDLYSYGRCRPPHGPWMDLACSLLGGCSRALASPENQGTREPASQRTGAASAVLPWPQGPGPKGALEAAAVPPIRGATSRMRQVNVPGERGADAPGHWGMARGEGGPLVWHGGPADGLVAVGDRETEPGPGLVRRGWSGGPGEDERRQTNAAASKESCTSTSR